MSVNTKRKSHLWRNEVFSKSVDWPTDALDIYERLTDEFVLEFRVGIYVGLIDELWPIDGLSIK